jgi:hypothetical protein
MSHFIFLSISSPTGSRTSRKCRVQLLLPSNTQRAAPSEISREETMHIPKDAACAR